MLKALKDRNFDRWLSGYVRHLARRAIERRRYDGPRHLLFGITDHYEPLWGKADEARGNDRVRAWETQYPTLADRFRDADGRPPRHSFFFPGEEYRPYYLDALANLAKGGYGEVEVHLHHDGDTAETLEPQLTSAIENFARHGHLSRDTSGRHRWAFIHGNWALANARSDGRWCGVDDELPLLFRLGCYADFTFPSAPDECQPNIVNQIYWPTGNLHTKRCYESGVRARVGGEVMKDRLLMIQGPLSMAHRPGKLPRIENTLLFGSDPPSLRRLRSWVSQNIHVEGRPEWVFVKVHTHGAPEAQGTSLLGPGGEALHHALTTHYNDGRRWILHYVTAREMYNIAIAAIEGAHGNPNDYRDYVLEPPPAAAA
jgi:hypothetical protein